jgi:hypothetical protein
MTRIGQSVCKRTVIGQQQQTFRIEVEPTCGIDPGWQTKVGQGATLRWLVLSRRRAIGELAQHVEGFVERNQHQWSVLALRISAM